MSTSLLEPDERVASLSPSEDNVRHTITTALADWPSAGLAVAVVPRGPPPRYYVHGVADVDSGRPVGEDTVFRIGSLTKTITAVAVMQLCEQGLVDLDAAAPGRRPVPARASVAATPDQHDPWPGDLRDDDSVRGFIRSHPFVALRPAGGPAT